MKFSYQDYLDGECTLDQFKSTLKLLQPKLGKVYKQLSATWAEMHWKIVFQDENISVGVLVYDGIYKKHIANSKQYEMFRTQDGFKYGDTRYNYRLIEEIGVSKQNEELLDKTLKIYRPG